MIPPILDVSSFQQLTDQVQKPCITDAPTEDAQQGVVIHVVEKSFDVSLHPPPRSRHLRLDLL
jgi:hypothetical protein